MGRIVLVGYRPFEGKLLELLALIREHVVILRAEGLATEREPIVLKSSSGLVVEVFEWVSGDAIQKAHTNAAVQVLWERFGAVCTYEPLQNLNEWTNLFAEFEALEIPIEEQVTNTSKTHIQQVTAMLHVHNLEEARHFFVTILGFTVLFQMDGYFYCEREGAGIRVVAEDERKIITQQDSRMSVYFDVRNVDDLYKELQTALETLPLGYVKPPQNYSWKQRELHIQMPDGNILAFGQPIAS